MINDPRIKDYIPQVPISQFTLREFLENVGGTYPADLDETTRPAPWEFYVIWMVHALKTRTVLGQGMHSVVYRVSLRDTDVAIKVGFIEPAEVDVQRKACQIGRGLPVYSYIHRIPLPDDLHQEICPHCGPDWRTDAILRAGGNDGKRENLFDWCRYSYDALVMPVAEPVKKQDVSEEEEEALYQDALFLMSYASKKYSTFLPEIKSVLRWRGRLVFIDFGDAMLLERLFL